MQGMEKSCISCVEGREDRFALFSAALDDTNWIEAKGKVFVQKMLEEWGTEETAPKGSAEAIRLNSNTYAPFYPKPWS